MNIFLIGMMGSGKSSVGQSLSKYLNNTFYDLDKEIEKSFNLSIKDIFLEYGEDLFRKEEEKLLGELNKLSGLIVSTGGGIVISNVNRTILKKNKTYFLEANIEDMYERALRRENDRPILKGMNVTQFKDLYEKRRNLYIESATKIINVEKKSTEDLVIEIVNNEKNII
jgi:shikimate kinase|tara:strand:- start:6840 stop:7346 length:507 start_codon:yes stop_codon:yes gene_type:complete